MLVSTAVLALLVVRSRYDPLYIRDSRFAELYRAILNQIASEIGELEWCLAWTWLCCRSDNASGVR